MDTTKIRKALAHHHHYSLLVANAVVSMDGHPPKRLPVSIVSNVNRLGCSSPRTPGNFVLGRKDILKENLVPSYTILGNVILDQWIVVGCVDLLSKITRIDPKEVLGMKGIQTSNFLQCIAQSLDSVL